MKAKDLRELTDAEITARIIDEQEMYQKMQFNHSISEIENPAKLRHTRRNISRMRTILGERRKQSQKED